MGTALVESAPAQFGLESQLFHGSNTRLHYVEGPQNGRPLLLLHGLTRDWTSFSVLLPDLVSRFHIFAVDLRGHGKSGRVPNGYRISKMAADIRELLNQAIPSPAALFGHSLGAMVGMFSAADNPSVSALIVGDSLITPENLVGMYDPLFSQLHNLLLRGGSEQELAKGIGKVEFHFPGIAEGIHLEELPGNSDAALLAWARTLIRTDPDALRMTLDRSAHEGWEPENILRRITC